MNWLEPNRWQALLKAVGASTVPGEWYERVMNAYNEPHRHYHSRQHLAECLAEFEAARHLTQEPVAAELALWFHDVVYDPKAADNEEQSAALAVQCMEDCGVGGAVPNRVSRLILATKHHEPGPDGDSAVVIDVDLAILGRADARFREYEAQIQREYGWVPGTLYASKRAEILERFLARERIFATDWFADKYERQARRNLEASIHALRLGPP